MNGMKIPVITLLCLISIACSTPPKPVEQAAPAPSGPVKITQFYTSASQLTPGEKAMVCYGVENARTVAVKPAVEKLSPAFNRCFNVAPGRSTRYTLTAEGFDQRSVTASFEIQVIGRPPAPVAGPVIRQFEIKPKDPKEDKPPTICYLVEEADAVEITPAVMPMSGVLQGCLYVNPKTATTYTLTAHGPAGKTATRQLTVNP